LEPRNIPGTVVRGFARTFRQCIIAWVIARSFSDVCDFAVVGCVRSVLVFGCGPYDLC
jgi:hypothetical protein